MCSFVDSLCVGLVGRFHFDVFAFLGGRFVVCNSTQHFTEGNSLCNPPQNCRLWGWNFQLGKA